MDDQSIDYPHYVDCILEKQSQTYSCCLKMKNKGDKPQYFYIVSTFGIYMKELTDIRCIAPAADIILNFNFKSTNIISHDYQFLHIVVSTSKLSQLCSLAHAIRLKVQLKFTQNFVDDPFIQQIVSQQVKSLLLQAENELNQKKYNQAKVKYQQAFQLLRKSDRSLYGMALCSFLSGQWRAALRDIETALIINPNNSYYQFLRAKILLNAYGSCKSWEGEIIEECFQLLKDIEYNRISQLGQNQSNELRTLIKLIETNPRLNQMTILKKEVISVALKKYSEKYTVSKFYSSKAELARQLRQILLSDEPEENTTPQQLLDPISYEIIDNPLILPSGQSFQQATLQLYFQKNGYKDPITRIDTLPQWIFPNNNLRDFIKDHPKLKIWKQYEYDLVYK